MKPFARTLCAVAVAAAACLASVSVVGAAAAARDAEHPRVFGGSADRAAVRAKIERAPWVRAAYEKLKANVDRHVALCTEDPTFVTSRLLMNWQTRYVQPVVEKERWVRGEGRAPIPTPRFAGARDWETRYALPGKIEEFRPYNDAPDGSGRVWLINKETKSGEWTHPGVTGRNIELANQRILQLAADAAFVHWVSGEEKYAVFAGDILWTYLDGFRHARLPLALDGKNRVIGYTSFEVIHEGILPPLALAYDFLHDHLRKQGRDVGMIQAQLKRMSDRIIDGGNPDGNWNLNQAIKFVYPALALEDDRAYADGKGRQYYVNVLLNARLPAQTGLVHVVKEGYDAASALWPEAPGYGFGTTPQIVQMASLVAADPAGSAILEDPLLTRAALAQLELLHPNGLAVGLGDTTNARVSAAALELLIASARKRGDPASEARLTAALRREIDGGHYDRGAQADVGALIQYVAELKPVPAADSAPARTYFGEPLNVLFQRSVPDPEDPEHALSAALYGTRGGHVHANGLAVELYGAGLILGADPGRGSSYWQADHRDYYKTPVAHNTVVVNGRSGYAENDKPQRAMTLEALEPTGGAPALSPSVSFATASFRYEKPVAALQQRTLAVVRTGPKSGFYFDVFRSRAAARPAPGDFHDYLYHNIGQSLTVAGPGGKPLPLAPSRLLAATEEPGLLKGYGYFKAERSADPAAADLRAVFTATLPGGSERVMGLWMPGQADRRVFALDAPPNRAIRAALPPEFSTMPMPTLLVRQAGDAWTRPFVAVYEPYVGVEGPTIRSVRAARSAAQGDGDGGLVACVVEGKDFSAFLAQDDSPVPQPHVREGHAFQGGFGVVLTRGGAASELYLGCGTRLGAGGVQIASASGKPVSASLRRGTDGRGWRYSSDGPVVVTLAGGTPATLPAARDAPVP